MNPGSRAEHDRFCQNEGWELVRNARGQEVAHHVTYELVLDDGRVLRTRISRPVSKARYGANLWKAILRDQLAVSEAEFWACVRRKVLPHRSAPTVPTQRALPAQLVHQLIHHARVSESEVAAMGLDEALAAMNEYWAGRGVQE